MAQRGLAETAAEGLIGSALFGANFTSVVGVISLTDVAEGRPLNSLQEASMGIAAFKLLCCIGMCFVTAAYGPALSPGTLCS